MDRGSRRPGRRIGGRRTAAGTLALAAAAGLLLAEDSPATQDGAAPRQRAPTLEETRLAMGKWIEQEKLIAKERNDWQQGKEILLGRLELVKQEIATLDEKIAQVQTNVAEADRKRDELLAQNEQLKAIGAQLGEAVTRMEVEVRRLWKMLPEPSRTRLEPLYQRIPEDPAKTRASVAERFQNVLGILNELNKANHEIAVVYEVRELKGGRPSEVRTLYVGLAQAYYVSAKGEAGIGRPSADGWTWQADDSIADEVLLALDVTEGRQSPAFVPLPVKLR